MNRNLSLRLLGVLAVLATWSSAVEATVVYSGTTLARGPEFASTTELPLGGAGMYQITTTDLRWLNAPFAALTFGAFTATAPIKTMTTAGTLEFFYGGQGKVFLQLYARPASGKSAGLIGVEVNQVAVVALPASLWLLLSALSVAGFWRWQERPAGVPSDLGPATGGQRSPELTAGQAARQLVKRLLPKEARTFIEWAGSRFGRRYALTAYAQSLLRPDRLVRVPIVGTQEFAYVRPTAADLYVYDEVFVSGAYRPPVDDARFIVDAGGHIGLTSLFFALRWPQAKIAVIEPDADNFRVLQANLGARPNVTLHHAAVWSHKTQLSIMNPADVSSAFRVEPGEGVQAVTIREIMDLNGFTEIDLLKMDVEGAEVEVFGGSADWIDSVHSLVVELHDRFKLGCREALVKATAGHGYATFEQGENTILVRAVSAHLPRSRTRRARVQHAGLLQGGARWTSGGRQGK
jgi:FkbM family methyltransferase